MKSFEHGPVELYLIGFEGERPGTAVVTAIRNLVDSGTVALLDLIFVSRSLAGDVVAIELEDFEDEPGFAGLTLGELGLAGDEDIAGFAEHVAPGTSAVLLTVELLWAKEFSSALFAAGGQVLHTEAVRAPIVNALIGAASI